MMTAAKAPSASVATAMKRTAPVRLASGASGRAADGTEP